MRIRCKLKQLCEDKDLPQLTLAQDTGLSPTTVGKLYRNQFSGVNNETMITLVYYFGLKSISELIEIER